MRIKVMCRWNTVVRIHMESIKRSDALGKKTMSASVKQYSGRNHSGSDFIESSVIPCWNVVPFGNAFGIFSWFWPNHEPSS